MSAEAYADLLRAKREFWQRFWLPPGTDPADGDHLPPRPEPT